MTKSNAYVCLSIVLIIVIAAISPVTLIGVAVGSLMANLTCKLIEKLPERG